MSSKLLGNLNVIWKPHSVLLSFCRFFFTENIGKITGTFIFLCFKKDLNYFLVALNYRTMTSYVHKLKMQF